MLKYTNIFSFVHLNQINGRMFKKLHEGDFLQWKESFWPRKFAEIFVKTRIYAALSDKFQFFNAKNSTQMQIQIKLL